MPVTTSCYPKLLSEFVAGLLTESEVISLERHLSECTACRDALALQTANKDEWQNAGLYLRDENDHFQSLSHHISAMRSQWFALMHALCNDKTHRHAPWAQCAGGAHGTHHYAVGFDLKSNQSASTCSTHEMWRRLLLRRHRHEKNSAFRCSKFLIARQIYDNLPSEGIPDSTMQRSCSRSKFGIHRVPVNPISLGKCLFSHYSNQVRGFWSQTTRIIFVQTGVSAR